MLAYFKSIFFSIISYSQLDDANVQTGILNIFKQLFSGPSTDPSLQIHNWLGIFGAVMANIFVNGIFGVFSIGFPVILFFPVGLVSV